MSAEENMALAKRFMEARVVKRDLDAVDEMLAPDFVNRNKLLPGQEPDREDYLQGIAAFHAALSEGHLIIEDQVAGGDKVVTRLVVHSPHDRGELMGVAPSGRVLTNRAIVIHRIVEGKIAEEWGMGTIGSTLRKQRLEQEISERERVEQELRAARSIQQASLPKEVPQPEGWQVSPYYQPAREVGGDFYDFFDLEDGRVGVVVGDATGKGMPAALVAEATSNMLRAVAQALNAWCELSGEDLRGRCPFARVGLLTDPQRKGTDSSWSMWTPSSPYSTLSQTTSATPIRQKRGQARSPPSPRAR